MNREIVLSYKLPKKFIKGKKNKTEKISFGIKYGRASKQTIGYAQR